ncbi:MAG: VOC family protein [Pseudomonadota bacterium]
MPESAFHLALPVDDLERAAGFYAGVLNCTQGRRSDQWIDYDFFGHQLVVHKVAPDQLPAVATNPVDGESVPASHFGVVLDWSDWDRVKETFESAGVVYVIEPTTRFAGRRGEQRTFFVRDPAGNYLEFKSFRNPEMLFAVDELDYE